ncbi:MAG TPA: quinolinate synthase [Cyanobacteria bacterium UBA11991]|nr:quinolinate synthase NadA [Cyanobacteriota bacterium]MDY6358254.1 quinolinate synthase NadA [Cyanobacteriota bacterium]MDY6363820.1 quinolinate synthase NadA [Cyanobacteriota bacterium]MDY6382352.1 quinolinate synthase NadA [Cyanobacteriota bacterium]HCB10820.1 quinolinate synthase [Cyanobacteria bacterium UBA11991]
MANVIEKIKQLKKEKNAVILAHCYQSVEIDEVADYVGDSLSLSQVAAKTDADIIVFAGVFFMAQTAKLLSPDKKVLLPQIEAGCRMADMLSLRQLKEFMSKHPSLPTVCYVNSTAEIKAECDICCTSANAEKIVKSLGVSKVLFVPDTYLGKWVERQLGNVEVITYPGFCPTHLMIRPQDVVNARKKYPDALVLAHPECHMSVSSIADYVGSTTGIMKYVAKSKNKEFIIATEQGVVDRLKRDYPNKKIIPIKNNIICPNMKMTTLEDILHVLDTEENEIFVNKDIAQKAVRCLDRMLEVSK